MIALLEWTIVPILKFVKVWHQFLIFAVLEAGTCKNLSNSTGLGTGTCKGFSIDKGRISGMFLEEIYELGSVGPSFRPSALLSFYPSVPLSGSFLGIRFFLKLNMVLGAHVVLCLAEPGFLRKKTLSQKTGNLCKIWAQTVFFL